MSFSCCHKNQRLEASMSDDNPNIPSEFIALEILSRLDVKTLARCTLVCKMWNSLLTSPSFISHHFRYNKNPKNESFLVHICRRESDSVYRELYSLRSENEEMELLQALENPPIHRFKKNMSFFSVVGSCNGLVCIVDSHLYSIVLWNPALQKYVLLPRLHVLFVYETSLGFGFDSTHNDFKVVRLVNGLTNVDAWVCSLAARSWKSIVTRLRPCSVSVGKPNVFLNGKLHWVAKHRTQCKDIFVLYLDVAEEVFGEILLPHRIGEEDRMDSICVFARGDSLAVSHVKDVLQFPIWCVWIMKEYDVVESWTRVIRIVQDGLNPRNVVALRRNGEMIIELSNRKILRYNPITTMTEDLEVEGDRVFIGYHKESLFLFDKGKGVMSYTY